ncbi:MAG: hypothetical protein PUI84_04465 [Bacteroidales bacterium]|nr:hypothetical protein [Porphyromonas sp.]MDD6934559.1 hypothetical protein [Bacteroidales bacterium]MDY3102670.1 hypothetical protein [Porphyromonas sp.]
MKGKKLQQRFSQFVRGLLRRIDSYNTEHPWVLALTCFVFLSVTELAFGEASIFKQVEYRTSVLELRRAVRDARANLKRDSLVLQDLNEKAYLEEVARTKYNFQRPDEVTFLIVDTTSQKD